jgi:serine/threonine protein kinase
VLGQYQFGALLGRGLSGLVFRANHRQTNQAVTVKVLSPDFPGSDAEVQAFVRVMKTVAPLRHPNLVTVHTAGRTGPYCWIAREYIEGESLAALIERLRKEDKLGWKRACRVAIHLGRVLNFLEQRRITLSRLTPTNVLIETATKTTKLADLMLDQALAGSQLAAAIAEERLLAELTYHAPEQTEPAAAYDLRSSLYALGAVVYKLLTGEPPFTGPTPDAIVKQIREAKVIKPSKFLEMPAPFEAAILKLLARKPEDRFQSATELLAVVQPIAEASEISV